MRSGKDASSDYSEGASHVLSVIHDILSQHRALEAKWHAKKIKLHQRLALRLFQEDVKQVHKINGLKMCKKIIGFQDPYFLDPSPDPDLSGKKGFKIRSRSLFFGGS